MLLIRYLPIAVMIKIALYQSLVCFYQLTFVNNNDGFSFVLFYAQETFFTDGMQAQICRYEIEKCTLVSGMFICLFFHPLGTFGTVQVCREHLLDA